MNEKQNFAWPVTTFAKYDYDVVKKWVEEYGSLLEEKQIVIFGAGIRGTLFLNFLQDFGYNDILFTDNNPVKVGGTVYKCPIVSYEEVVQKKEEVVVVVSIENATTVKEQLVKSGFVENQNFFYLESSLYKNFVEEFSAQRPTLHFVLGDCGLTDIAKEDTDHRSLSELIRLSMGEDCTKSLAVHAMGMRGYYHILHAYMNFMQKPKNVVVMANFDALTGKQHMLPRSQNAPLIRELCGVVNHQDAELEEYAEVTQARFDNFTMDCFTSSKENMSSISQEKNDRLVFRISYMYELNYEIEPMVYMKKIIHLCKENKINLLFFIPPVNSEYAQELLGSAFREKYDANVASLREFIGSEIPVLDFSDIASREEFAQRNTVDEIVKFDARKRIAERLAQAVSEQEKCHD